MVGWSTSRAVSMIVAVLLASALTPIGLGEPSMTQEGTCSYSYVKDIGPACRLDNGLWKVQHNDGTIGYTHGGDPLPQVPGEDDHVSVAAARDPECISDPSTEYHHVLIYARAHDDDDRYASIAPQLQDMVKNINGLLHQEATGHGALAADYRFRCTGGQITVYNEALPTDKDQADFNTIVSDLRAEGYDNNRVKYWVWYDDQGACSCAGIGHIYNDDRLAEDNYNNGRSNAIPMFGVTFGYLSSSGERVMMHENGHNMGAVQLSAPNASPGGYHCNDGQDIMCYDDSGGDPPEYDPGVCSGDMRYDCNKDDYFHPDPPPGSHLHDHWNIGSQLNRFLTITMNLPPVMHSLSCEPDPSGAGESVTCTFRASDESEGIYYEVDWGDGTNTRVPSSGYTAPGVDQEAAKSWQNTGEYTITVTATDDATPGLVSDPLTSEQEVYGPVAVAEATPLLGKIDTLFTFDGSSSHHPLSSIVSYEWTRGSTTVSTQAVHETTFGSPGDHCLMLRVVDEHGIQDTDTACVHVNHPPQAEAAASPETVMLGDDATFDGTGSLDPDGTIASYEWIQQGSVVSTNDVHVTSFSSTGLHCLLLVVTDAHDESDSDEACVQVVEPEPPVAVATSSVPEANRAYPVTLDGSASRDTNPGDPEMSYEWRLDGTLVSEQESFTKSFSSTGTRCYELTVTNPWGLSDTDTACVTITSEYRVSVTPTQASYLPTQQVQLDVYVRQVTGEGVSGADVQVEVSYTSGDPAVDDLLFAAGCTTSWSGSGSTISGFVRFNVPSLFSRCVGSNSPGEPVGDWHVQATGSRSGNTGSGTTEYHTGV